MLQRVLKSIKGSIPWYPFIVVNAAVFTVFNLVPWISMFDISFRDTDLLSRNEFIGLDNYVRLVQDDLLRKSLVNTFAYLTMYVPAVLAVSLLVAILVNRKVFGVKFFRAAYFLPNVTSIAVLSLIFRRFLSPRADGPINYMLGLAGIDPQPFLLSVTQALPSLATIGIWESFGYYMVIFLAGLQTIPKEINEAAAIDGANARQRLRRITVPLLNPSIVLASVIGVIYGLQLFTQVYVMTGSPSKLPGGPIGSTTSVVLYIVQSAFRPLEMGYPSAAAMLLFVIIMVVTLVQLRVVQRRFEY